ncbi:MAG: hypothetical protein ABID38_07300 [Candidatus Diapherotrites archaeon]
MPREYNHPRLTSRLHAAIKDRKVANVSKAIDSLKKQKKQVTPQSLARETGIPLEVIPALWKAAVRKK